MNVAKVSRAMRTFRSQKPGSAIVLYIRAIMVLLLGEYLFNGCANCEQSRR